MKRNEYLEQLKRALSFLPEESRQAALAFYGEMLDDRMEDGLDEESAVAAMEKVEDIAARLRTENVEEIIAASPLTLGIRDEALEFASLADSALKGIETAVNAPEMRRHYTAADAARDLAEMEKKAREELAEKKARAAEKARAEKEAQEEKAAQAAKEAEAGQEAKPEKEAQAGEDRPQERQKTAWENVASDALDAVGQALEAAGKTVGDLFSDQGGKGTAGDFERREFTCRPEDVEAVRLTLSNMPIRVRPAEGDAVTLIYYTCDREPYRASLEGGVLSLWNPDKEKGWGFGLNLLVNGFKYVWNQKAPTVELLLPPKAFLDLTAHTSNGSVRVEGMKALCGVDLKTSNSRISLQQTVCMSLTAVTSNSRLVLEEVEAKKELRVKTSNARIEAVRVRSGGSLILSTSNGRIELTDGRAGDALSATTSNASIQASILAADSVTLRSSNGGITGVVPGRRGDWAISSGTSNAKNSLPRQQDGEKPLSVHTSNAGIHVRFAKE